MRLYRVYFVGTNEQTGKPEMQSFPTASTRKKMAESKSLVYMDITDKQKISTLKLTNALKAGGFNDDEMTLIHCALWEKIKKNMTY